MVSTENFNWIGNLAIDKKKLVIFLFLEYGLKSVYLEKNDSKLLARFVFVSRRRMYNNKFY